MNRLLRTVFKKGQLLRNFFIAHKGKQGFFRHAKREIAPFWAEDDKLLFIDVDI